MVSEELNLIIDELKSHGKMAFLEATTEDKIDTFENEQAVTLPSKYKEWLQFSDGGEFFLPAGIQLYGIEHKPLTNVNNNSRPNEDYIVIGALASGDLILCEKNSEKIAIYNQEAGRTAEAYKAILAAWNKEQELVKEGKGTREWTHQQQQDILDKDKG